MPLYSFLCGSGAGGREGSGRRECGEEWGQGVNKDGGSKKAVVGKVTETLFHVVEDEVQ